MLDRLAAEDSRLATGQLCRWWRARAAGKAGPSPHSAVDSSLIARAIARFLIAACLTVVAPIAVTVAQSEPQPEGFVHHGLTPAEAAYYEAQRKMLVAYVECLKAQYVADLETTPTSAAGACGAERAGYAALLAADLVSLELDIVDYRVGKDHGRE